MSTKPKPNDTKKKSYIEERERRIEAQRQTQRKAITGRALQLNKHVEEICFNILEQRSALTVIVKRYNIRSIPITLGRVADLRNECQSLATHSENTVLHKHLDRLTRMVRELEHRGVRIFPEIRELARYAQRSIKPHTIENFRIEWKMFAELIAVIDHEYQHWIIQTGDQNAH